MNNPASRRSEVTSLGWINCPVCRGMTNQFDLERVSSLSGIRINSVGVFKIIYIFQYLKHRNINRATKRAIL